MVADIYERTFKKNSRSEYKSITLTLKCSWVESKRHIFDTLGWMHMVELGSRYPSRIVHLCKAGLELKVAWKASGVFFPLETISI